MEYSIKNLIFNSKENADSGIITIPNNPEIIIANRYGKPANSYDDLVSIEETDFIKRDPNKSDEDFVAEVWEETEKFWINKRAAMNVELEKMKQDSASSEEIEKQEARINSAKCYNGNITSVIDILYDPEKNTMTYLMDRCKYSLSRASSMNNFPNTKIIENHLSFGLGMASLIDVEIAPLKSSLLMMERSDTVHTEKKAFCVPAGTMEFTEELDPIQIGLKNAVLHEVCEEILPTRKYVATKHPELSKYKKEKFPDLKLNSQLTSIHWIKRPNGTVGLNNIHNITSDKTISMDVIFIGYTQAEDAKESTGNTKFVDLEASSRKGEDSIIATPRDIIDLKDKIDPETRHN